MMKLVRTEEIELHQLINISSCGLDIIYGSFRTVIEVTGWNMKATAKGTFQILHDSSARRADYISVSGSNPPHVPLCHKMGGR